jgi:hypothetical protein
VSLFKQKIKNPRRERRGIEDFPLKSCRMRGNKSPTPLGLRPKGRGIEPDNDSKFFCAIDGGEREVKAF